MGAITKDGQPLQSAVLAGDDHMLQTIERPKVRHGRLPDPSKPYELFANPSGAASLGLRVGDSIDLYILPDSVRPDQLRADEVDPRQAIAEGKLGPRHHFTLVGTGVSTGDVVPGANLPTLFVTPAFVSTHHPLKLFEGIAARLQGGDASIDRFSASVRAVASPGATIDFQTTSADRATVNRAVRPQVVALMVFGLVLGIGALAAVAQALSRRSLSGRQDETALAALGMTRTERGLVDVLRAAVIAVAGGVLALTVAIGLSVLLPFGVARPVEPNPGVSMDLLVLSIGLVVIAGCTFGAGVLAAARARRRVEHRARSSRVVAGVSRLQRSPTVVTGMRFALDPGPSDNPVPTRSTLIGAVIGIGAIVASLTFAGSLRQFVTTPRSYGWDFDALVQTSELSDANLPDLIGKLPSALATDDVSGWSTAYLEQTTIGHQIVPVLAFQAGAGEPTHPTIVSGRAPSADDEVALGAATLRTNGVGIGDDVVVGDGSTRFHVVGTVVLPGLRRYEGSDQAALGSGALLTYGGLERASTINGVAAKNDPSAILIRTTDPDSAHGRALVQQHLDKAVGKDTLVVSGPERPSDVLSYARVRIVPILLATVLGLLAAVTVGHALAMAVRQRRIDLAVLHALGFTRAQVGKTVAWQASTVAFLATVIGVPVGLIVGRTAWSAVAHQLGIVDVLVIPVLVVAVSLPLALLLANAMAAVPARRAAGLRMTDALRAE
jgi:hypothetical protein